VDVDRFMDFDRAKGVSWYSSMRDFKMVSGVGVCFGMGSSF